METGQSGHVDIERALRQTEQRINRKLEKIMAAQDDINAAVAALQQVSADLLAAVTNIQAQLAAGQQPDTSQLDASVTALQAADAAIQALETPPAPPAP